MTDPYIRIRIHEVVSEEAEREREREKGHRVSPKSGGGFGSGSGTSSSGVIVRVSVRGLCFTSSYSPLTLTLTLALIGSLLHLFLYPSFGRYSLAIMKIFRWSTPPNCASTPRYCSSRA